MSDKKDLIARLAKATGPDRNIDGAIAAVIIHPRNWPMEWRNGEFLAYTDSLDAALTLVPAGWAWALHHHRDCSGANALPFAKVSRASWNKRRTDAEFYKEAHSRGSTPALALCTAAIKARAVAEKQGDG